MAVAYSVDLRERVLEAVYSNELSIEAISKLYKVHVSTIRIWRRMKEREGTVEPKKTGRKEGSCLAINDVEKFKEFIDTTDAKTQSQMAKKWGGISAATIGRMLRRINYTFKKKPSVTQNATKKNEKNTKSGSTNKIPKN